MTWAGVESTTALLVMILHLAWILWVIFGAFWTSGRRWWTAFHVASLVWGILVEIGPWPCPLTIAEDYFLRQAGLAPYRGSFLLHWVSSVVYPNVSVTLLIVCGVAVCAANLGIYGWRAFRNIRRGRRRPQLS
jgi:Protein of Unknown function (DUF2784)